MNLIEERDALVVDIEFCVKAIANPRNTIDRIGDVCEQIAEKYRVLAICRLLADADTDGFYHDLLRSAKTREYYLSRCRAENYADFHVVSSRSEPFFDAIAANDFSLARNIAGLSPQEWWSEDEYEDDFWYIYFLKYISFDPTIQDELDEILQRFEISLEGASSARFDVCKALLVPDQEAFDDAFNNLVLDRNSEIEREKELFFMEEMNILMNRHVFVEGLAVLRVAEKAGLQTQGEYLYCPALARLPMKRPFPDDGYPNQ